MFESGDMATLCSFRAHHPGLCEDLGPPVALWHVEKLALRGDVAL